MIHRLIPLGWCAVVLGATLAMVPTEARCQEIRVRLILADAPNAVPAHGITAFQNVVLDAAPDVGIVGTLLGATDLIELGDYSWNPDDERGVCESWRFSYRPLYDPVAVHAASSKPADIQVHVCRRTAAECARASALMLRERLQPLLKHIPRVVPR